tara:strand:+ start:1800 stop:2057 length:258 start_codon:yes stop_codon:yes gene_type:complete
MNLDVIKNLLLDISQFEIKEIFDNSHHHSKHAGVQNLNYPVTHITIKVLNTRNLSRIEIHRQIYKRLNSEIEKGLHSIEIKILND